MRRQGYVGHGRQRRVFDRLVAVNIERDAAQLSGLQGLDYSGVVQQLATSAVDQPHALLHLADRFGVDHALGLRRQAHMQRDVVGLGEDLVERCQRDVQLLGQAWRDVRIVGDDLHAEGQSAARDFDADAAESDDAERLAAKLGALQRLLLPLAGLHGGVSSHQVARQ